MTAWTQGVLGKTGRAVGRLGLASGYGADARCVELAYERGVNYFYWGSLRRASFGAGLRNLRWKRDSFLVILQSYSRIASLVPWSIERALRALQMDCADVLLLGLWNKQVTPKIIAEAHRLRQRGLVRHLAISTHNRPLAPRIAEQNDIDILHIRYNAMHPGAEREIFPRLMGLPQRPGLVSFTATSWGQLLRAKDNPPGEPIPSAGDCYRFVLSNPAVDVCLAGPKSALQLQSSLEQLERGPMTEDELAWMRRVGEYKYRKLGKFARH